jgi:probable HAF family extracellular repeat protein
MPRVLLSAVLSLSILLSTLVAAQNASYTFATFDVHGALRTEAYGINDGGQIVGNYQDASAGIHSFLYTAGIFTSLDVPVPGALATWAQGINNRGQIVGYYEDQNGGMHGFLYDQGVFTSLDVPLPGAVSTVAFGINNRGQIVGSYIVGSTYHGFVYDAGVFTPLDAPGASQTFANGINFVGCVRNRRRRHVVFLSRVSWFSGQGILTPPSDISAPWGSGASDPSGVARVSGISDPSPSSGTGR